MTLFATEKGYVLKNEYIKEQEVLKAELRQQEEIISELKKDKEFLPFRLLSLQNGIAINKDFDKNKVTKATEITSFNF